MGYYVCYFQGWEVELLLFWHSVSKEVSANICDFLFLMIHSTYKFLYFCPWLHQGNYLSNISSWITLLRKLNACCKLEIGINPCSDECKYFCDKWGIPWRGIFKGISWLGGTYVSWELGWFRLWLLDYFYSCVSSYRFWDNVGLNNDIMT